MKMATVAVQKSQLQIFHDSDSESPREWSNLGYFITVDNRYHSPDKSDWIEQVVKSTSEEANDQEHHMKLIKKGIKEGGEKVLAIYPVVKYEHGGVSYSLGSKHGFDFSNNGFYIITDKTQKETGTSKKDFEKVINQEIDVYNSWANGEVYGYCLTDENGENLDSCSGFYSIDDIKDHLPEEWKTEDLNEYIEY